VSYRWSTSRNSDMIEAMLFVWVQSSNTLQLTASSCISTSHHKCNQAGPSAWARAITHLDYGIPIHFKYTIVRRWMQQRCITHTMAMCFGLPVPSATRA
jgi:hypothetical protein